MIHYHGTPLTPRVELRKLAGKNFCVSFANPGDADWCLEWAQSVMWDNGAYSIWRANDRAPIDWAKFYKWVEPRLSPNHWAVVPDVIEGLEDDNLQLINQWPHHRTLSAVVWHMNEGIDHLLRLVDLGFGKVCFGSTKEFDPIGCDVWCRRCDEAFNALSRHGHLPQTWIHMMRGLALAGDQWPFSSADSTNVARNFKNIGAEVDPERMSRRLDAIQCPIRWTVRPEQRDMFNAA